MEGRRHRVGGMSGFQSGDRTGAFGPPSTVVWSGPVRGLLEQAAQREGCSSCARQRADRGGGPYEPMPGACRPTASRRPAPSMGHGHSRHCDGRRYAGSSGRSATTYAGRHARMLSARLSRAQPRSNAVSGQGAPRAGTATENCPVAHAADRRPPTAVVPWHHTRASDSPTLPRRPAARARPHPCSPGVCRT